MCQVKRPLMDGPISAAKDEVLRLIVDCMIIEHIKQSLYLISGKSAVKGSHHLKPPGE
jgi:hypothetical protein